MKTFIAFLMALHLHFVASAFAVNQIEKTLICSRSDDDLATTYATADLHLGLRLTRQGAGFDARLLFSATIRTPERQGFMEAIHFGMAEVHRYVKTPQDEMAKSVPVTTQPIQFRYQDPAIQREAERLLSLGPTARGNYAAADGAILSGELWLGTLGEGTHSGRVFVQQVVGGPRLLQDTDQSVRHVVEWIVTVRNGDIHVDIRNDGRYYGSDITLRFVPPQWSIPTPSNPNPKPHRVSLLQDQVRLDGGVPVANATARYGTRFGRKFDELRAAGEWDELEGDYSRQEIRAEKKAARRGGARR